MSPLPNMRVGYVVKRYPRYSQTFVVTEILAHEAAGLHVEIFVLQSPSETHFQDNLAHVKAPVHYLLPEIPTESDLWTAIGKTAAIYPRVWQELAFAADEQPRELHQALLLSQKIASRGITHLHAHFAVSPTTVAMLASRFTGVPYSFTAHANDILHENVRHRDMERKLSGAAAVVAVSNYNRDFLRQSFGQHADRVQRLYNGLDLEKLHFVPPAERPPRIVAVGRLVEQKGFASLVKACAILKDRALHFECEIVGYGELEPHLRGMISDLRLNDHVWLIGPRPQAEAFKIVQSGAVFAAPCVAARDGKRDGLPTVLLEAMALGTPCVSTDVTGIPEVIRDGETGLCVPQHDAHALASALEKLLTDSALRVRLATAARRLIESDFDTARNTETLREIFANASSS